jgi:hypothetical protein
MEGWIKIHRTLATHDLWESEPFTRGQAWVDLLMLANAKPGTLRVRGNRIDVDPGQVGWSVKRLASRWQWSRGKVQRFLDELEDMGQIEQQKSSISSLLTVTKWAAYQSNGQQTGSRRAADGQQTGTNKKERRKEGKKKREDLINDLLGEFPELATPEFIEAWEDKMEHRKQKGQPQLTERGTRAKFKEFKTWGVAAAIQGIRESIANDWTGIFQPKANNAKAGNRDTGTLNTTDSTDGLDGLF